MNKKIKALTALVLLIQLLVPTYLLAYHHTIQKYAEEKGTEYKFRLNYVELYYDNSYKNDIFSADSELILTYYLDGLSYNIKKTAAVSVGTDGFARISRLDADKKKTDIWFNKKYCKYNMKLTEERFTIEPGTDRNKLIQGLTYKDFNWNDSSCYLTAKVYKGIFIPTAIYYEGTKIITISL